MHLSCRTRRDRHQGNYTCEVEQPVHLVITRNHPKDVQDRPVYLWIDGEKWDGALRYGKTFERDLPPGHHKVRAHNTLFGDTVEFDAKEGETVRYQCENGLTGGGMAMILMMGVAYLKVKLRRI